VYSYEKRKEFLHIAHKNISKLGLTQYVVLKNKDIRNGIDEKSVDLIVLDIPDPWNATDHAWHSLKPGGFLTIYLPNVTSILKTLNNIKGFYLEGIYECFVRRWIYREEVLRPESTQLVHTEFLILLRKMMR
jgi:tRNA (adenine57-N1/adenine58-N1)-methyltransferase